MTRISICVLAIVAFAAAFPSDEADHAHSIDTPAHTHVTQVTSIPAGEMLPAGAGPAMVVLAEPMMKELEEPAPPAPESHKLVKRFWHSEETTPAPVHHGWPAPPPPQPIVIPIIVHEHKHHQYEHHQYGGDYAQAAAPSYSSGTGSSYSSGNTYSAAPAQSYAPAQQYGSTGSGWQGQTLGGY